jgi:hypothetical protein
VLHNQLSRIELRRIRPDYKIIQSYFKEWTKLNHLKKEWVFNHLEGNPELLKAYCALNGINYREVLEAQKGYETRSLYEVRTLIES